MTRPMSMLRPCAISQFDDSGTFRFLPITERELNRSVSFFRRVLASDWDLRDRFALVIGTQADAHFLSPFERALQERGVTVCNSEANAWDGARTEATIRRFDVAVVAVVTQVVLQAIRNAGFDPIALLRGKIVWAAGPAYDDLEGNNEIDLRRWIPLGPAFAIEGRHRGGAHYDSREWTIETEGEIIYVTSRLDRALAFTRLPVQLSARINNEPSPGGAPGPRIVL